MDSERAASLKNSGVRIMPALLTRNSFGAGQLVHTANEIGDVCLAGTPKREGAGAECSRPFMSIVAAGQRLLRSPPHLAPQHLPWASCLTL